MRQPLAFKTWMLSLPASPHLAARADGVSIDHERIVAAFGRLAALSDLVIVEGAGGWFAPISATQTVADVAGALALPVILVVGMRLGCLNHALLTAEAIRASGLPLTGWIANAIDPSMAVAHENVEALRERLGAPLLGRLPHEAHPIAPAMARYLDVSSLLGERGA